jgi:predicted TIM-barrel fold metal-dependent hydrolase
MDPCRESLERSRAVGSGLVDIDTIPAIEMHSHIVDPDGIAVLRDERIAYALVMTKNNLLAFDVARKNSDILGALLWLDPTAPGYCLAAEAALGEHADIVKGFKLHPDIDRYDVTFDALEGVFALANERRMMIQAHTGGGGCNAARFAPLLAAHPETTLVLLHGHPADEAWALARSFPNVYVDLSATAWGKDYQSRAVRAVGKTRIVMGLDSPEGFPTHRGRVLPHFRDAMRQIASFYDHDADILEHVFYENGRRMLGLARDPIV